MADKKANPKADHKKVSQKQKLNYHIKLTGFLIAVRFGVALFFLVMGIILYITNISNNLGTASILVSLILLVYHSFNLFGRDNIIKHEESLHIECSAHRVSLLCFFLYIFVILFAYRLNLINPDLYLLLGSAAVVVIFSYILSYYFYSRKKKNQD